MPTLGPAAGVKTNRTRLFTQVDLPNPVLPPGFSPNPPSPPPPVNSAPQVPPGFPAPLVAPPVTPRIFHTIPVSSEVSQPPSYLLWDSESKDYNAKFGEPSAHFTFHCTNVSKEVVLINSVRTSCGCTVAQLPSQPWRLEPGASGPLEVTVNLAGKVGTITKSVSVDSSTGTRALLVKVNIAAATNTPVAGVDMDRMRNMQLAMADRQAVFKGDCAKCHADPARGQTGAPLYTAACGNCHDSPQRAGSVPDLKKLNHPTNAEHWKKWIASGRPGSMMPAFAKAEGGPLDDVQIESLVKYLTETISNAPHAAVQQTRRVVTPPVFAVPPATTKFDR
jgi:mono/diheme cytochrome c family protein